MNEAMIVAKQILQIFIYIAIGMACVKTKVLTKEAGQFFVNLSLFVIVPLVLVNSLQVPLEVKLIKNLVLVLLLAIATHTIAIITALLLIKKRPDLKYRIERHGISFANSGFMAIPLVTAIVGPIGTYYVSIFIGIFNILTWTIGIKILSPESKMNLKKAILNPGVIGFVVGIVLHLLRVELPEIPRTIVSNIAGMNTPLAMITAGIFLSSLNFKKTFVSGRLYFAAAIRLIIVPVIIIGLMYIVNLTGTINHDVALSVILAASCPAAVATIQFSSRLKMKDSEYAAEMVAMTTLLSIISLPFVSFVASRLF